jgi:hypothetical protein
MVLHPRCLHAVHILSDLQDERRTKKEGEAAVKFLQTDVKEKKRKE